MNGYRGETDRREVSNFVVYDRGEAFVIDLFPPDWPWKVVNAPVGIVLTPEVANYLWLVLGEVLARPAPDA